jgi:putative ABC transport system permease protein
VRIAGKSTGVNVVGMMPGYLETIGATVRQGRLLTPTDYTTGVPVVIINESAARALFPEGPAVGGVFSRGSDPQLWTVIGVIADLRHRGPVDTRDQDAVQVFFPLAPSKFDLTQPMTVVMRPSGDLPGVGEQVRQLAQSIGPRVLVERIRSGNDWFDDRVITPRRRTVLLALLGALGLTLSLVGVFAMTAYAVTRRTGEIGVRMAFGATPAQVVHTMVRDSVIPIAIGTAIGVGGAMLATKTVESFLFDTAPRDPATLAIVALTLVLTGCFAALVPALRAAKVDPSSSLRTE